MRFQDENRIEEANWLTRFDYWFAPLLGRRSQTFRRVFQHVLAASAPVYLLETGCVRHLGNWAGDGQSTVLFDDLVSHVGGNFWSVDIDAEAVEMSRSITGSHTTMDTSDSIAWLAEFPRRFPERLMHLIYLDSYDIDWNDPHPSALHHLQEFVHAWHLLRPGGLLVVDDDLGPGRGKGMYIRDHLQRLGIAPLFSEYQVGWVKPEDTGPPSL